MRDYFRLIIVAVIGIALIVQSSAIQAQTLGPYVVRAGHIYNITKFVTWPEEVLKEGAVVACIPEGGEVSDTLKHADGRTTRSNIFRVVFYTRSTVHSLLKSDRCNLFYSAAEEVRLRELLGLIDRKSILTISESKGSMIQFVDVQKKVKFIINRGMATRSNITLSSRL